MSGATPPVLTVRDLDVAYRTDRGDVHAVRGATFELMAGQALALVGESGSGKTTLAAALVRLLPDSARIARGDIRFRGQDGRETALTGLGVEQLRRFRWQECAMVFQSAQNAFNPVMRIGAHFEETYRAHRAAGGVAGLRERAAEVLRMVQLDPARVLAAYPHQLSGGMRQRVLLALGLLLRPRVLILDEPTTALDVITQRAIIEVIRRLKEELGFAMIFVTHDLSLAAELADRVATMYAGRIVETGTVDEVFFQPQHPYTVGLLRSVPTLAATREQLLPIPGSPPDLIRLPAGCPFHPRCPLAAVHCESEDPPIEELGPDREVACWNRARISQLLPGRTPA
jgi:peptide/nickel transport system ATP-binding protein